MLESRTVIVHSCHSVEISTFRLCNGSKVKRGNMPDNAPSSIKFHLAEMNSMEQETIASMRPRPDPLLQLSSPDIKSVLGSYTILIYVLRDIPPAWLQQQPSFEHFADLECHSTRQGTSHKLSALATQKGCNRCLLPGVCQSRMILKRGRKSWLYLSSPVFEKRLSF